MKLLKFYQRIIWPITQTLMPGLRCRFYPTCSHYAREAVQVHGIVKGSWLALKRLVRCNPLCEGGVDMVPPKQSCKCAHKK